jgi:hypothetical protein
MPSENFSAALISLCDAANRALSIFSDLELRGDAEVNKPSSRWSAATGAVRETCQQLRGYCDTVLKGLEELRPTLLKATGCGVSANIDEAVGAVGELSTFASVLADVRDCVSRKDLSGAKAVIMKHQRQSLTGRERSQTATLITWLKGTWVPAMERWAALAAEIEEARRSGDEAHITQVAESVKQRATSDSSALAPVALRGESVESLVSQSLITPAKESIATLGRVKTVEAAVDEAIARNDFATLATLVREAQLDAGMMAGHRETIERAKAALLDLQRMAKVTLKLSDAVKDREPAHIVAAINAANEMMVSLGLCGVKAAGDKAVTEGAALLRRIESGEMPSDDAVAPLLVEHVTARGWAPELSLLYYKAGKTLKSIFTMSGLAGRVAAALDKVRGGAEVSEDARELLAAAQRAGLERSATHSPLVQELSVHVRRAYGVTVKLHYDSATRVMSVAERFDFSKVRDAIVETLHINTADERGALRIRYEDDGDFVVVDCQADWEHLVCDRLQGGGGGAVRVELYCDRPATASFASPVQTDVRRPATPTRSNPANVTPPKKPVFTFTRTTTRPEEPKGLPPGRRVRPGAVRVSPPPKTDDPPRPHTSGSGALDPDERLPARWAQDTVDFDLKTVQSEATTAYPSLDPYAFNAEAAKEQLQRLRAGGTRATSSVPTATSSDGQLPRSWDAETDALELRTVASEATTANRAEPSPDPLPPKRRVVGPQSSPVTAATTRGTLLKGAASRKAQREEKGEPSLEVRGVGA